MRSVRIIGIDPGLRRTGWGVVDADTGRLHFVACGSVVSDETENLGARLRQIFDGLSRVLAELTPVEAAIEQVPDSHRPGLITAMRSFATAAGDTALGSAWKLGWPC